MPTKQRGDANRWVDPDTAPPLGRAWFERAEIRDGERLVRPAGPVRTRHSTVVSDDDRHRQADPDPEVG
jgi:hypothetical protein